MFQRYLNKAASGDELRELMELLQQSTHYSGIKALLDSAWNNLAIEYHLPAAKTDAVFNAILAADRATDAAAAMPYRPARRVFILKRLVVAAAILLLLTAGWWFFYFNKPTPPATKETQQPGYYAVCEYLRRVEYAGENGERQRGNKTTRQRSIKATRHKGNTLHE
ncbi:hypothetical protein FAM09_13355 [Niastella caeni]|uniref:Uncharacterized protein n=1 Tax=Niastella caeni TaxID=2569763 RepID=A0A4S8HVP9_9BACT|nr:hypothetical protein [Niastella caeni]THU39485.1 hypothetical protein FAM09_13355 [Niastella caeni]